ncbi:MAG TPA: phosphate signaling complex protein PhoU [Symbiobacteriaceae bacterium]
MGSRRSFEEQLETLQRGVLKMGAYVTEAIHRAVDSLVRLDEQLARDVIAGDDTVDRMLVDLEKGCLQVMALHQPMARDLRRVGAVLKIVTDLERIADHATDIAMVTLHLQGDTLIKELVDIRRMAELVQQMTMEALEAYIHQDVERARRMIAMDDEVDRIHSALFDELLVIMQARPETVKQATYLILVSMYLERVGDHATNLGEWTIYLVTGELKDLNR